MSKGKSGVGKKGHGSSSGAAGTSYAASSADVARYLAQRPEQLEPLRAYTGTAYRSINELLRDGFDAFAAKHGRATAKATLTRAQATQRAINRASEAGHAFSGEVLRRQDASQAQVAHWIKRGEITNRSLLSTTIAKSVLSAASGNVVLHLKQHSGVALAGISHVRSEKEVLIPAGRRFKITKVRRRGTVMHIYARQIR